MDRVGRHWPTIRAQGKRLVGWLVVALVVAIVVAVVFLGTPYEGPSGSIAAVDDEQVSLERTNGGYVIEPATGDPEAGLVFYPGARVDPGAYVGALAPLARDANVTVVVPHMPLNLAAVDYAVARTGLRPDAATVAMGRHSSIDRWYVGGHSLGGAMACRYARNNADSVAGLVLYGSYCDRDLSGTRLAVLSVAGTSDTVLDWETYERNLANLPASATIAELQGINHTQFGSYTGQPGDTPTGTSYEQAHARLNAVAVPWLQNETAR